MIRLIVFLVIAVAVAVVASWFADNPGRVTLTWQGMRIETSVAILALAVLAVGILITMLFEILRLLRVAPRRFRERRHRARESEGYLALSQGMVAAAAGDTTAARQLTRRAEKLLDGAPQTLLLSAQTAQLEGDEPAARQKFQRMLRHPETEFLGLRGLLAQAMKEGDVEGALRLARRAYQRRPQTAWVLNTLFELQTRAGQWDEALATVADMKRAKLVDRDTATRRRAILIHQQAADARAGGRPYAALELARKAHKLLPALAPLAVQLSEIAEQVGKMRIARKALEASWQAAPHPAIARAYVAIADGATATERLRALERLYAMEPGRLEGELVLAEAAISAREWKTARAALERALRLGPTASVYRLLAEVEQAEGGSAEKARAWLAKAVDAPSDPAWICATTGEVRPTWSAFGPDGRFDSLRWGQPPKIVPLLRADAEAQLIPPLPAAPTRPDGPAETRPVEPAPVAVVTPAPPRPAAAPSG
jgi:HemY protein